MVNHASTDIVPFTVLFISSYLAHPSGKFLLQDY
jgi:hypothetical protein